MAEPIQSTERPICSYEGTSYRANFWEGHGREYEDLAERVALRRLLPPTGQRLVELGAGFGRLADLYSGYAQVVLLDYATTGLHEAQERLGRSDRWLYVAADIYHLPLAPAAFDTAVTIRVLHHLADVPAALDGVARALRPQGAYVLEYANKRNLKAIARYLLRRQRWSPFAAEPYEFTKLNFDFHPAWMAQALARAGFAVEAGLAVSHFRHPAFKRLASPAALAALDGRLQRVGAAWKLAPSVFLRARATLPQATAESPAPAALPFCCPRCASPALVPGDGGDLACQACGARWAVHDGIYDFRAPVA